MALGQGCRLGFLGTLHSEIFRSRLSEEYGQEIFITAPTVPYKICKPSGEVKIVSSPVDFPEETSRAHRDRLEEPVIVGTLTCPEEYVGEMMQLCSEHRGEEIDLVFSEMTGQKRQAQLKYRLPMAEIVTDFFSQLKSRSSGFANFEYEIDEENQWQESDLVKVSLRDERELSFWALIAQRLTLLAAVRFGPSSLSSCREHPWIPCRWCCIAARPQLWVVPGPRSSRTSYRVSTSKSPFRPLLEVK